MKSMPGGLFPLFSHTYSITNILLTASYFPDLLVRSTNQHLKIQIVKKMMDLGTVKKKLERGQYNNAAECAADIRLVW